MLGDEDRAAKPDTRSDGELVRAARHEAAHAVVAWAQGEVVDHVDIALHGEIGGKVRTTSTQSTTVESLWARLVLTVAAKIVDGRAGITELSTSLSCDSVVADEAISAILADGVEPPGFEGKLTYEGLLAGALHRAGDLLEEHDLLRTAITRELLAMHKAGHTAPLTGTDIDALHWNLTRAEQTSPRARRPVTPSPERSCVGSSD